MDDFSNYDKDVFLIKADMIDRGAMMSRYSRTNNLDIRDLYNKEFKNNPEKAEDFYKRVFLDYGDESVAELTTAQLGIQNISNILSKIIEEPRIGLSYLEKSSRYVRYDKKHNNNYLFLKADDIGIEKNGEEYNNYCNELFDFYSKSYNELMDYFREKYPINNFFFEIDGLNYKYNDIKDIDDKSIEKSYKTSLRSSVLDEIRDLLPASTLTNIGISGNGRSFISLIERLTAYDTKESTKFADLIYNELKNEMPELIDEAVSEHGKAQIKYKIKKDFIVNSFKMDYKNIDNVKLLNYMDEDKALDLSIKMFLYPYYNGYDDIKIDKNYELNILNKLIEIRKNRRDKIGRAFESINYVFEVNTNYGAFRELQRHRFLSIIRKPLNTYYGYDIPEELGKNEDLRNEYIKLMEKAKMVYMDIKDKYDYKIAQYCVPYGYKYPVIFNANLNELTYFIELRSGQPVHPDLRKVAINMYNEIKNVNPDLSRLIKFVDTKDYKLGRLPSELRKEKRINNLKKAR